MKFYKKYRAWAREQKELEQALSLTVKDVKAVYPHHWEAAVLGMSLPAEQAAELYTQLNSEEVQVLMHLMSSSTSRIGNRRDLIVDEFLREFLLLDTRELAESELLPLFEEQVSLDPKKVLSSLREKVSREKRSPLLFNRLRDQHKVAVLLDSLSWWTRRPIHSSLPEQSKNFLKAAKSTLPWCNDTLRVKVLREFLNSASEAQVKDDIISLRATLTKIVKDKPEQVLGNLYHVWPEWSSDPRIEVDDM